MTKPNRLVVVVGTATEVGKTWVSARVLEELRRRGNLVAARKPAQSFDPDDPGPTDAGALAAATGEDQATVCPEHRWYPVPMAVGIVETVGGVRSPITDDADSRDLVRALVPDRALLVADAALGTIDRVRGAVDALAASTPIVFLNRFDPNDDLHRRNRDWLAERDGHDIVTDLDALADRLDG